MREQQLLDEKQQKARLSPLARGEEHQGPETNVPLSPARDLLSRSTAPVGDALSAQRHAAVLRRMTAGQSWRAGASLRQLQRRYGNRYLQRVVDLARKSEGVGDHEVPTAVEQEIERMRGGGQPMESGVRTKMERAFGADFSGVRIHHNAESDVLNRALGARAFTTGRDIFFRSNEYQPGSSSSHEILAHELTHVVQQTGKTRPKLTLGDPDDQYEREANQVARRIVQEDNSGAKFGKSNAKRRMAHAKQGAIQRVPEPPKEGKYRYGGFKIKTPIIGFIQDLFSGSFEVDYTSGSYTVWWLTSHSFWELYDHQDNKIDKNIEWLFGFGKYTLTRDKIKRKGKNLEGEKINREPGLWSLWYTAVFLPRIHPYDVVKFIVSKTATKRHKTEVKQIIGKTPCAWAIYVPKPVTRTIKHTAKITAVRGTTVTKEVKKIKVESNEATRNYEFSYKGLGGQFSNTLSQSQTEEIAMKHNSKVEKKIEDGREITATLKPNESLEIKFYPIFNKITGDIYFYRHRDGVIRKGEKKINGSIFVYIGPKEGERKKACSNPSTKPSK